ncbi:Arsenical resistance operon repressor [Klebsiella grimontii]|uniref:Arsenical resistance operon repressor n=1 Tax=Klebsiella grimontii TaxID=2058152 RepID=A0A7H4NX48_9ENTR|nr:Arsenical resistance operon repressor [Klebsiella grimontii]
MSLTPLQLFKNLSDETRLGIVLLLKEMGNCACAISVRRWISRSPRSPAIWLCCGKADYCWIASRVSGCTIAYHRICLHGRHR